MAFELTVWRHTKADWARGEWVAGSHRGFVSGDVGAEDDGKVPWVPAAAVVGVLGLMFFWTKAQAQKHKLTASRSVFAMDRDRAREAIRLRLQGERDLTEEEEKLRETTRTPLETLKKTVYGQE